MPRPERYYRREMKSAYDYQATWFPIDYLELGWVGLIEKHRFTMVGDLKSLGIEFEIVEDPDPGYLELVSSDSIDIDFKAQGTIVPDSSLDVNAGFRITFGSRRGFVFRANGCRANSIKNPIGLKKPILQLYDNGDWDKKFVVVTKLIEATSGTVIIAMDKGAKIELKAQGNINPPANQTDISALADISAELSVTFSKNIHTKIIGAEGMRPLYNVWGIVDKYPKIKASKNKRVIPYAAIPSRGALFDRLTPKMAREKEVELDFAEIAYEEEEDEEESIA